MGPDCYIYEAELYCEKCADAIKEIRCGVGIRSEDVDESDSENWPQGPYSDDESDSPSHCSSGEDCLDPTILPSGDKVGKFFENPLTSEGEHYVKEMHRYHPSELTTMWMDHYDLKLTLTQDQRRSRLRARLAELSSEDAFDVLDTIVMTILGYVDDDGDLDSASDCIEEILDDLDNHGLNPLRLPEN